MTNSDLPATIARLRELLPGPDRCRVCGWTLSSRGCRIGDCSYRPSARGQPDDGLWRQRVMVRADDVATILDALEVARAR